MKLLNNL